MHRSLTTKAIRHWDSFSLRHYELFPYAPTILGLCQCNFVHSAQLASRNLAQRPGTSQTMIRSKINMINWECGFVLESFKLDAPFCTCMFTFGLCRGHVLHPLLYNWKFPGVHSLLPEDRPLAETGPFWWATEAQRPEVFEVTEVQRSEKRRINE